MDSSAGSTCYKSTSPDSPTEDSVMIVGEYTKGIQIVAENTCMKDTPASPIKESSVMQGKDSNTIDLCDDSFCMPTISPATPRKGSLPFQKDISNTMGTSVGSTCFKNTLPDSPTEDSVTIVGEYSNSIQIMAENTCMKDTASSSPMKASAMMQGKDSNIIDLCYDSICMPITSPATPGKISLTVQTDNSNSMDTSTKSTCSKCISGDSPSEDSVIIVGEYSKSIQRVAKNISIKDTPASPIKKSETMQGNDYNIIDLCDDSTFMPIMSTVTPIKSSLTVQTDNSNPTYTSTKSTCSKSMSLDSPTEDSVMIVGDYSKGIQIVAQNSCMEDTTLASPIKESETMQSKDSNTINQCDNSNRLSILSPATPSKTSLLLKLKNSNPCSKIASADISTEDAVMKVGDDCDTMDISTESTCSKCTSHDNPIEYSRLLLGDDPRRIDRGTKRMWETETSPIHPAEGSVMVPGEESKSLKIGTEHPQYFNFHPRVVNHTDVIFSEEEIVLLNKYLKFIIEPDFDEKLALELLSVANIAVEVGNLKKHEVWRVQYKLWKAIDIELKKQKNGMINQKRRAYQSTIESINKKLSEGEAVARKADEGDFIVIIKEKEYIEKTLSYFEENCISEISNDITDEFQAEINKYLNCECSLFGYADKMKCHVQYSNAPELTPLLKVQNADISIRPMINTESSPAYKLTMLLNQFLRKNYVFSSQYSVSCVMALINEITNKPITKSSRLASMGISNLYANIPVDETIRIVENNLFKYGKVSSRNINEFVKLLKLVAKFNYFSFNNKFYNQSNGLALGSSFSDTMADIFINNLEQNVLKSHSHLMNKIVYYRRSVDKILLLVDGTEDDIDNICSTFNRFHGKIDFSVEHESNNRIQFLDIDITRLENQLTFNVFRKPTTTDAVIPSDSCHPQNDKEAAFRSLLHRAHYVPMSKADRLKELNIIKQIAHSNGYEMDMVSRLMDEERRNKEQIKDERKIVRAPYYGEISEKLANMFKSYNVKFVFQAKNLEEYNFWLDIGKRKRKLQQAGIYKLKCASCNAIYIGKTMRTFLARYKEHVTYDRKSAVARHMMDTGHQLTGIDNALEVLHIEEDKKKRDLLEKFEITIHKHRFGNVLLNKQRRDTQNRFFDGFVELFLY